MYNRMNVTKAAPTPAATALGSRVFPSLRRRVAATVVVGCLAVPALAYSSTHPDSGEPHTNLPAQEAVAGLSGEEIFGGLFFGDQAAAAMFPELWSNEVVNARAEKLGKGEADLPADAARARLGQTVARLVARRDPAFFERFAGEMKSGNPSRVSAVVDEAQSNLNAALQEAGLAPTEVGSGAAIIKARFIMKTIYIDIFFASRAGATVANLPQGPSYERDALMSNITRRFASMGG
jgi:SdpC family antimicrobial peptide